MVPLQFADAADFGCAIELASGLVCASGCTTTAGGRSDRDRGGEVTYDYELNESGEPPVPTWLRELVGVDWFGDVLEVFIYDDGSEASDMALEHLKGLTNLKSLDFSDTQVTDAGLKHLKGMTSLECLNLFFTQVTDAGLEHRRQFRPPFLEVVLASQYPTHINLIIQETTPDPFLTRPRVRQFKDNRSDESWPV